MDSPYDGCIETFIKAIPFSLMLLLAVLIFVPKQILATQELRWSLKCKLQVSGK